MNAALYCRKSTDQAGVSDDQKSVVRQIEHARAYAVRKGWTVADEHIFVDDGVSGAETKRLLGRARMIEAASQHRFDVVIMQAQDRFSRGEDGHHELKQLARHVAVWFYADDQCFESGSFASNTIGFLKAEFAAEYRRAGAAKTAEAMQRKARAGHVCGGRVFGYKNSDVIGADGRRSHVTRTIEPTEADVVRQIFRLSAEGLGVKGIAKRLNEQGAPSPRAQLGRSQTWAPTSVRAVLYRPLYRGEIVWNASKKRDPQGQHHQTRRPEADWIRRPAPELRIVTDEEWTAAHARLTAARRIYFRHSGPEAGRPALGSPSKYLLTNLALCGCCGGPLKVRSGTHGTGRRQAYGCAHYHERGRAVCLNKADVPMQDADDIVIEALLDDILDPTIIEDSIGEALRLLQGDSPNDQLGRLDAEIAAVTRERDRLVSAIAAGGELAGLVDALRAREVRQRSLEAEREARRSQRHLKASETARVREELITLAQSWRRVLATDVVNARPIVTMLLKGRVTITPMTHAAKRWILRGEGTLTGMFARVIFPLGMASPPGLETEGKPFERTFRAA